MTTSVQPALTAIAENLRFFTRLPIGASNDAPDFAKIAWAAPLAGAIVGAMGGIVFFGCRELGLAGMISATLTVAAQLGATGCLHEDGLADVADGFGGGRNRDAKLAIMRDSRIGVYGAIALALVLLLRIQAIEALAHSGVGFLTSALVLAAAGARGAALAPLAWAPSARAEGVGASAGRLRPSALRSVALVLAVIAAALGFVTLGIVRACFACMIAVVVAWSFVALALRQIGGQTGDVCGATAAIVEVVMLLVFLTGVRHA